MLKGRQNKNNSCSKEYLTGWYATLCRTLRLLRMDFSGWTSTTWGVSGGASCMVLCVWTKPMLSFSVPLDTYKHWIQLTQSTSPEFRYQFEVMWSFSVSYWIIDLLPIAMSRRWASLFIWEYLTCIKGRHGKDSALVGSQLDYAIAVLHGTSAKNLTKLQGLQNCLARVLTLDLHLASQLLGKKTKDILFWLCIWLTFITAVQSASDSAVIG